MKRRDFFKAPVVAVGAGYGAMALAADDSAAGALPVAPGLTRQVCEFIVGANLRDIPEDVLALAKKSILDGLGLALAGSASTLAPILKRYVTAIGPCQGDGTVIGTALRLTPRLAAFANGTFIHADDYDDTQLAVAKDRVYGLLTHPTVPVLPAALALGEAAGASGADLLTAYLVGVEVECKIAEAVSPRHYNEGFHTTGTVGPFGSAAACARLRRLDAKAAENALGIAATESGGLRANFGSMTKPFHAGRAAESGIVAVDLAALGWTAAPEILETRYGWFQAAGGGFDPAAIVGRLGKPWTLAMPGVSIKPHPSGSLTHPAMGEMARLIERYDIKPAQVEKVVVGGNSRMVTTLLHHQPKTGLQAKFSLEFGMAILLLDRKANLSQYTDAVVQRADVQELMRRVSFTVDPEAEQAGFDKMTSILKIYMKDGRVLAGRAQFAKGSPADPMSFAEVAEKFRGCAEFAGWPRQKGEAIVDLVRGLDGLSDVRKLTAQLAA